MDQPTLQLLQRQLSDARAEMSTQLELNQVELKDGIEGLLRRYQLQNQQIRQKASKCIKLVEDAISSLSANV